MPDPQIPPEHRPPWRILLLIAPESCSGSRQSEVGISTPSILLQVRLRWFALMERRPARLAAVSRSVRSIFFMEHRLPPVTEHTIRVRAHSQILPIRQNRLVERTQPWTLKGVLYMGSIWAPVRHKRRT